MTDTCPLCIEPFNRSDHARVCCEQGDCEFTACKQCTRQYLLGTTQDPHCMSCRKSWSQDFLVNNLNHSWMAKDYRAHRKGLLLDREISKIPETMVAAERVRKCRDEEKKINEIKDQMIALDIQKRALQEQQNEHYRRCRAIRNGTNGEAQQAERRKFIMACPNNDCRGYLSTGYKCGICNLYTCKDCLEVIGYNKDDPHECNPDSVKSAELIRKDTHPCPTCGERIYKISGCDQMWCPHCATAFSWKTGQIDTGHVHNPHFYQAQRARNNGTAPRNPGDVLCGGLIHYQTYRRLIHNRCPGDAKLLRSQLDELHQFVAHVTHAMLHEARAKVRELGSTEKERVEYILGEITKDVLGQTVLRNDRLRTKWTEFLHLYELLSVVGIETFTSISELRPTQKGPFTESDMMQIRVYIGQYHKVREMCNDQFKKISVVHSISVPQISETWTIRRSKFTAKALREAAEAEGKKTKDKSVVKDKSRKSKNIKVSS